MKRTNLVLDERLLEEALRLSGERTYSRTVERALSEFVRRIHAGRILDLAGSGLWEGDLAAMRDDRTGRERVAEVREKRPVSRRRLERGAGARDEEPAPGRRSGPPGRRSGTHGRQRPKGPSR